LKKIYPIALFFVLAACQPPAERSTVVIPTDQQSTKEESKAILSFMGEELPPKALDEKERNYQEKKLAEALENLEADPDNEDNIIWHGRRLALLGKYNEAIDVYSEGLQKFPTSYRLRRHRGHRYINTRQIDKALEDLEMAAFLSTGKENKTEPDGTPNRYNQSIGNDKFYIWYHYALAHYLNGRFDKAVSAYNRCMDFCENDDTLLANSYWLYLSAKRGGNDELAQEVLDNVKRSMQLIEMSDYFELLLLFKDLKKVEDILENSEDEDGFINPTLAYGIGNWYLQNNQVDEARSIFWKTLETPFWDTFGYIATEADIQNMATSVD